LPIYPARELPIEGVTSELILGKMKNHHKKLLNKQDVLKELAVKQSGQLIITAGAGDIDTIVEPMKKLLTQP